MTQQHQYKHYQSPSSLASHGFFSDARCTVMVFSSISYFSFRFSNGSL
ncbi:hypothetical protein GLP26_13285 [Photobacterium carnosum]|nr:hypothetical protein [Photobacterium carnosum]